MSLVVVWAMVLEGVNLVCVGSVCTAYALVPGWVTIRNQVTEGIKRLR